MKEDITDIKVTLARVTTTMEGVGKILERHEANHEAHYTCCNENKIDIADLKATRRTIKWVLGFFGLSGLAALIKGAG